jgi:hypothetical protein
MMHVSFFFFLSCIENSGCYGNKKTENIANLAHRLDPVLTQKYLTYFYLFHIMIGHNE